MKTAPKTASKPRLAGTIAGHFLPREISFQLPELATDPFDYLLSDVQVQVLAGGKKLSIPAFYDGDNQWRARFTPLTREMRFGDITLNGEKLEVARQVGGTIGRVLPKNLSAVAGPGFVRVNAKNARRFQFDNGADFFPLGHNAAWRNNNQPDLPAIFAKMSAHGENWTRVWMNHWDGKNLDWPLKGKLGDLNLDVARRWDSIVKSAEENEMVLQMVFQHHGQYSTTVNPNWDDNPYSVKNGGFLNTPDEFFTSEHAKSLTKRKLRYSIARWGYSPSIMAWELWNEVQFTDAARFKKWPEIAAWHSEMAAFIREQDAFKHLITTSSTGDLTPEVWAEMDYFQEHAYPSDLIVALGIGHGVKLQKPFFVGEFGPADLKDEAGKYLHAGLWSSLFSNNGGAAQYWDWDAVEKFNLYGHFEGAARFLKSSKLGSQTNLRSSQPKIATESLGDLNFGPGGGWGAAVQNEFTVEPTGAPDGIGTLPKFLQGQNHRAMNPKPLGFKVNFARSGTFTLHLSQIAKAGAHLKLSVGQTVVERDFSAGQNDLNLSGDEKLFSIPVPAGRQIVTLENSGQDWAVIERFSLSNYAPSLTAHALGNANFWAAWVYSRADIFGSNDANNTLQNGKITVTGLRPGRYRATWANTHNGIERATSTVQVGAKGIAQLEASVKNDAAVWLVPLR